VNTVFSAEGTVAHDLGERSLASGLSPHTEVGKSVLEAGFDIGITEEMADAVQVYVDFVHTKANEEEGLMLLLEHSFDLTPLSPPDEMFGTADAVVWNKRTKHLHVIDYKHGAGVVVDAEFNDQGFVYSLGATVELITEFGIKPENITFTIVQPRGYHPDGEIRSWDFTYEWLVEEKKALFTDAEKTLDPDAPLVAGDHCQFCKAHAICPAQRAQVVSLAQDAFAVEPTFPDPVDMAPADVVEVLTKGAAVEAWIKAVRVHAQALAEAGIEIPGFKLVESTTHRRWVDAEKTDKYLTRRGLKKAERFSSKLISPAQAEKALKARGDKPLPEDLVLKPEGRSVLAPASDKRPERVPGAQDAFGVIAETSEIGDE
jgi:hypothetical protein